MTMSRADATHRRAPGVYWVRPAHRGRAACRLRSTATVPTLKPLRHPTMQGLGPPDCSILARRGWSSQLPLSVLADQTLPQLARLPTTLTGPFVTISAYSPRVMRFPSPLKRRGRAARLIWVRVESRPRGPRTPGDSIRGTARGTAARVGRPTCCPASISACHPRGRSVGVAPLGDSVRPYDSLRLGPRDRGIR